MSVNNQRKNVAYGLSDALLNVAPLPIVSLRAPLSSDLAPFGQIWIDKPTNTAYILTSIVSNAANWLQIAGAGASFSSLTVSPGPTSLTGALTVIAAGNAVQIANDAAVNAVTIGSVTGASSTTIQGGTAGIALNAAGNVAVQPGTVSSATTSATLSKRVGIATFTGQTTAAADILTLTITNTFVTAASAILLTVANGGSNDARMSIEQILPSANTIEVIAINNGTAALNGNVTVTFWVLN